MVNVWVYFVLELENIFQKVEQCLPSFSAVYNIHISKRIISKLYLLNFHCKTNVKTINFTVSKNTSKIGIKLRVSNLRKNVVYWP